MAIGADILIVIASLVCGFALASAVAAWSERVLPVKALVSLAIGAGILLYVHVGTVSGLSLSDIPDAFILVAARILN